MEEKKKFKLSLATQIFIALVLGIGAGMLLQDHADIAEGYIKPNYTKKTFPEQCPYL